ncbi:DUF3263 domain-containing protein [Modestobacter sp. Leaf380]|uniref:DUF3263 domain-containing protein n=1 Tax=Modestobacter sp. Leaf380 TaxID=1736356 RepID=UPI0006F5D21D|nr:DUF3263 domain-containing protein [Modestobacter sp. Leaf380]KQS68554.1 hypothetical protein ASG41_06260 [Modestobacter sp. Leaf380]
MSSDAAPATPLHTSLHASDATGDVDGDGLVGESSGLPRRERDVLAFERQWWRYAGAKEAAIKEQFGLSATRYYQVLNTVIDRPEALAADPLLVRRLRRMRATRQRQRSARTLGIDL